MLSVNPSGDLAQIPYISHSGPTMLGLNFDGENFYSSGGFLGIGATNTTMGAYTVGSPSQTDMSIQNILFRVSEIYAPFNVDVTRVVGADSYYNSNGNSTVFVGPSADSGAGDTPGEYTDYPTNPLAPLPRDGEAYHLAFVDPFQNNNGAAPDVATALAHEAGHTFGLAHVRTDGLTDPAGLQSGNTVDVMSYNRITGLEYFNDQSLPFTRWNQTSNGLQLSLTLPVYLSYKPTTEDSFYSLGQELGSRIDTVDTHPHVADIAAIDPQYQSVYVHSNSDDMDSADSIITEQGAITRLGDYDVYRWTAPATETVNLSLSGQNGLDPVMLVYDNAQAGSNNNPTGVSPYAKGNNLDGYLHAFGPAYSSLNVQAGQSYYFVVGGHDSDSTGTYQFTINQLPAWAQLSGGTLSINGNQIGAATETLSIDSTPQRKLVVSLNGLPQKVQFEPGQITAINVNSLGSSNTINIAQQIQNLGFLPAQMTINAPGYTNLYVNDGLNQVADTYTISSTGLTTLGDTINYSQLSSLTLTGGRGNDKYVVPSTPTGVAVNISTGQGANEVDVGGTSSPVTINDGLGTDTIIVGTGQNLDSITGVTVNGNGRTALTVDDQANPNSAGLFFKPGTHYTVTDAGLTRTVFYPSPLHLSGSTTTRTINYQNLSALTLNAGNNGPNTIDIEGTPAPTTINGGAPTSEVDLAPTLQTLDYINGP
jgi:hypothetical protein